MGRLMEAMQSLGLQGEAGRSGRWIRFQRGHCAVYVVEAAWGEGYYAFCDALTEDPSCEDPGRRSGALFLDPVRAIETCLRIAGERPNASP
jgi:hypothetical protein